MLQGVLLTLEILGVIILALLCLLLLLVLAVIFAPFKYRAAINYTEENKSGEVYLSWFFHFVIVQVSYDLSSWESSRSIKIFGIDPQKASQFFRQFNRGRGKKARETFKKAETDKENASSPEQGKRAERAIEKTETEQKENLEENDPQTDYKKQGSSFVSEQLEESASDHIQMQKMRAEKKKFSASDFFKKRVYKLRKVCDTIKNIPTRLRTVFSKPQKSLQQFSESIRMLREADAGEVLKECWDRLLKLLNHYRVREGKGYFRFGTGDPASTGELTGLIYMILPASCGKISIEPQFTESALDMELHIRGHIRVVHILMTAWWAFRNKKLREVVTLVRNLSDRY